MIGHNEKTSLKHQNRHDKYILKTNQPFSFWKHNAIYFQVNVQRRQTAFHAEQQNLDSTENNFQDENNVQGKIANLNATNIKQFYFYEKFCKK